MSYITYDTMYVKLSRKSPTRTGYDIIPFTFRFARSRIVLRISETSGNFLDGNKNVWKYERLLS